MAWSGASQSVVLSAVFCAALTQVTDPTIRLTSDQLRRATFEFGEARIVRERSIISTQGTIELNPAFTTIVATPVAAASVTILVSAGGKVENGTVVATVRPEGAGANDEPIELRSPVDGSVVSLTALGHPGVPAKSELMTISDLTRVLLVVSLPASEGSHLVKGQSVAVAVDGVRDLTNGHISALSGRETTAGSVLEVALEVDDQARRYRVGRLARAQFVADRDHAPVSRLVIPSEAVASVQERDVVFIPVSSTEFRVRPIAVEARFGPTVYVQSGLQAGDRIVTAGAPLLEFVALTQLQR